MEISFLGTSCAIPTYNNGSTSFLVRMGDLIILVDASDNPVKSILNTGINPLDLDIVLLTHYHADHLSGFPALISTLNCMGRKKSITVIANNVTEKKARKILSVFELDNNNISYRVDYTNAFKQNGISINLIPGLHSVPTSMVLFKQDSTTVFFTADTNYNKKISEVAKNCNLLIHEATYSRRKRDKLDGHSSAYDAGLSAANAGVEKLFLCHICENEYCNIESVIKEAKQEYSGKIVIPELFVWYKV